MKESRNRKKKILPPYRTSYPGRRTGSGTSSVSSGFPGQNQLTR